MVQNVYGVSHPYHTALILIHEDILNGATLNFEMGSKRGATYAVKSKSGSIDSKKGFVPFASTPVITATATVFHTSDEVNMFEQEKEYVVHYTKDGSIPDVSDKVFEKTFHVDETTTVLARAYDPNDSNIHTDTLLQK